MPASHAHTVPGGAPGKPMHGTLPCDLLVKDPCQAACRYTQSWLPHYIHLRLAASAAAGSVCYRAWPALLLVDAEQRPCPTPAGH